MSDQSDNPPGLSDADRDTGRWVLVASFRRAFQAHLAACALEGQNIPTRPGRPPLPPMVMGCELMVRADDYPRAVEILKQTPAKGFLNIDVSEQAPTLDYGRPSPKPRLLATWRSELLAIGVVVVLAILATILVNCFFHG